MLRAFSDKKRPNKVYVCVFPTTTPNIPCIIHQALLNGIIKIGYTFEDKTKRLTFQENITKRRKLDEKCKVLIQYNTLFFINVCLLCKIINNSFKATCPEEIKKVSCQPEKRKTTHITINYRIYKHIQLYTYKNKLKMTHTKIPPLASSLISINAKYLQIN